LPACCCQPAVARGIIYTDLWGELSTHLALQALFAQISPVREPLLQAFPFPSTLGKVTMHPCCQACVFIYSSCGRWVFPHLLCSSPPTSAFTSFPAPDYWAVLLLLPVTMFVYSSRGKWSSLLSCGVFLPPPLSQAFPLLVAGRTPPLLPEALWPARLVYLQSQEGFPFPNLLHSVRPTLFPVCLICSYCLLLSFSFFPRGEVSLSRGLCCCGQGLSVGILWYHKAHLVRVFLSHLGAGNWQPGGPPGFSI
jgi:hypothetical protein